MLVTAGGALAWSLWPSPEPVDVEPAARLLQDEPAPEAEMEEATEEEVLPVEVPEEVPVQEPAVAAVEEPPPAPPAAAPTEASEPALPSFPADASTRITHWAAGGLTAAQVGAQVQSDARVLGICERREDLPEGALARFALEVEASGEVRSVTPKGSTTGSARVDRCFSDKLFGWRFGPLWEPARAVVVLQLPLGDS